MVGGTGCSSIGNILQERYEGEYLPKENVFKEGKMILNRKHNSIEDLMHFGFLEREQLSSYFKFATIRNPFDHVSSHYARIISAWDGGMPRDKDGNMVEDPEVRQKIETDADEAKAMGFDQWVARHYGFQARIKEWIKRRLLGRKPTDFYRHIDFVIRFESLQEGFDTALDTLGIESKIALSNTNPTKGKKHYREYYSPKSRKMVESYFRDFLRKYDYSF